MGYTRKKHEWDPQDGFRIDKCKLCEGTRKWDAGFQRIVYYNSRGEGPFFWAPACIGVNQIQTKN